MKTLSAVSLAVAGALVGTTLLLVTGDAPVAAPLSAAPAAAAPIAPHHGSVDEGGGFDLRPRLVQASHFSGTTNTGREPAVQFLVRHVSDASVATVAEQVRARTAFVDAAGRRITAVARTERSRGTSYSHAITLAPARALDADAWYTLTIDRDPGVVVGGPEDMLDDPDAAKQVRLFTGSAPQIRRLARAADPAKPAVIEVVMSEPVELGELVRLGVQVQLDARPLAGCVVWDAGCVEPAKVGAARVDAFSFRPDAPLREARPRDLAVAVSGRVRGAARSVEEGATLTRARLVATGAERRHIVAVPAAQWNLCSDTGDVQCWRAP